MKIHNVGMATKNLNLAIDNYMKLGFVGIDHEPFIVKDKNIKSMRIKDSMRRIMEIITVLDNNKPSQISNFLEDTNVPVIAYYLAFETYDIKTKILDMKKRGYKILDDISIDPYEKIPCAYLFS